MNVRCLAISLSALVTARYGTGSGSDRAPVTRSLPLPVPYRNALATARGTDTATPTILR